MDKIELAHYVYTLHMLMQEIDSPPVWLATEYQAHWEQLETAVTKEHEDEARKSELQRTGGSEDGTEEHGDKPGLRR